MVHMSQKTLRCVEPRNAWTILNVSQPKCPAVNAPSFASDQFGSCHRRTPDCLYPSARRSQWTLAQNPWWHHCLRTWCKSVGQEQAPKSYHCISTTITFWWKWVVTYFSIHTPSKYIYIGVLLVVSPATAASNCLVSLISTSSFLYLFMLGYRWQ